MLLVNKHSGALERANNTDADYLFHAGSAAHLILFNNIIVYNVQVFLKDGVVLFYKVKYELVTNGSNALRKSGEQARWGEHRCC